MPAKKSIDIFSQLPVPNYCQDYVWSINDT